MLRRSLLAAAPALLLPVRAFAQFDGGPDIRPRMGRGRFNPPAPWAHPFEAVSTSPAPKTSDFAQSNINGTSSVSDYGDGVHIFSEPSNGGFASCLKAAPPAPFSVYVRFWSITNMHQFASCGLILRNSSNGRCLIASNSMRQNAGTNWEVDLMFERFTTLASFNAGTSVTPASRGYQTPSWLRFDVTATTCTLFDGQDGLGWRNNGAETLSTFLTAAGGAADQIGFGAQDSGSSAENACDMFVQVFATTAPAQ